MIHILPYQYTCARCGALVPYGQRCPCWTATVSASLLDVPANRVDPARGIVLGCLVSFGLWCVIVLALAVLWQ